MLRNILFVFFGLATFAWLLLGHPLSKRVSGTHKAPSKAFLDHVTEELKEDPISAATVTKLRENKKIHELALASAIRQAELRGGLPEVRSLLKPSFQTTAVPAEVRLAMLATDPSGFPGANDREHFLHAHGSVLDVFHGTGNTATPNDYLTRLEAAHKVPSLWRRTFDNAMAFVLFDAVKDDTLRAYYEQEKDENWLEETLVQIGAMVEDDSQASDSRDLIANVLRVAQKYHPYFKQSIKDHEFDASVYFLFETHGDLIRDAIKEHAIPLSEVLEVAFANLDFLEQNRDPKQAHLAETLAHIRNEKPYVWTSARQSAFALRLNEDVPQHAEALLKTYSGDDIAVLLYAGYENEVVYAADALAKFDDLAVYILCHYQDTPKFREALTRPGIGPRLIPYVAAFGDEGLDRLAANEAWLDKYFFPDGTPREKEWWTQIPGGAALDVARNWTNGHPNEWSELGWGALDVADAALLIASFGTSSAVTTPVKEGGKTVIKKVTKDQIKRNAMRAGRRQATATARKQGARAAAKQETRSLLRQFSGRGMQLFRAVRDPVSKAWKMTLAFGKPVVKPAEQVFSAAKKLYQSWERVSPTTKKIVYRSLLAVGLFVTITERTIPALPDIGEAAGMYVRKLVEDTAKNISEGLENTIKEFLGNGNEQLDNLFSMAVYVIGLVVLAFLTWLTRPVFVRYRHA